MLLALLLFTGPWFLSSTCASRLLDLPLPPQTVSATWFPAPTRLAPPVVMRPVETAPGVNCTVRPAWREHRALLDHYLAAFLAAGCAADAAGCRPVHDDALPGGFEVPGSDSGFEDHAVRRGHGPEVDRRTKAFQACHDAAKRTVYQEAASRVAIAAGAEAHGRPLRVGVFAAQGCLHNRDTWGQTWNGAVGPGLAIFSDCALGRLYRAGIDVSLPTLPYPRLFEQGCSRAGLFDGALASPPAVAAALEQEGVGQHGIDNRASPPQEPREQLPHLLPPLPAPERDVFFLGSPTSRVREALRTLEAHPSNHRRQAAATVAGGSAGGGREAGSGVGGSGGGGWSWNITVGGGNSRKIHLMTAAQRSWTCSEGCDCLERAAGEHHALLRGSSFGLVPRGHGVYSYRLTEVLLAGAVPVVLANGWVLPFSEILEWDAFSVRHMTSNDDTRRGHARPFFLCGDLKNKNRL